MSLESAAAILVRLEARIASAILNEMEPARAAQLANTITDTPKTPPAPEPGAEPRDRKNSEKTG
jgi:flagellar motility protein MotE (MotC chaperone)